MENNAEHEWFLKFGGDVVRAIDENGRYREGVTPFIGSEVLAKEEAYRRARLFIANNLPADDGKTRFYLTGTSQRMIVFVSGSIPIGSEGEIYRKAMERLPVSWAQKDPHNNEQMNNEMNVFRPREHEHRVIAEKADLDYKIKSLEAFIAAEVFPTVSAAERARLERQAKVMRDYSAILGERIAAFPK